MNDSGISTAKVEDLANLVRSISPKPMSQAQIHGYLYGLQCGLSPEGREEFFPEDDDPDDAIILDSIDEIVRANAEDELSLDADTLIETAKGQTVRSLIIDLLLETRDSLDQVLGGSARLRLLPGLGVANGDLAVAKDFAEGMLRGLAVGADDEEQLMDEAYGEPINFLLLLSEDEVPEGFGSATEVAEARRSVVETLPGVIAKLWEFAARDPDDD